jgi:Fe/S biogenesis protein NfuA
MADTTTAEASRADTDVLRITPVAIDRILKLREAEDDPSTLALRIEVTGTAGVEYAYDLTFDPLAEAEEVDAVFHQGELPVIVPVGSIEKLSGATLDVPASGGDGLVLRNPNRPNTMAASADLELTGSVAERVEQLLAAQINPMLAAHGGFARLQSVDGDTVYVTMGGGCHGCAVSSLTLRAGIARSIKEAIPEVAEVLDATDHSAGANPYY